MASSADPGDETEKPTTSGRKGSRNPSSVKMEFVIGSLLEARDFANNWFPSKVVEVDVEGREVLVHFQNWSSRYDEWISMDSARLRPVTNQSEKVSPTKTARGKDFKVGEKVMAVWHNNKRYPAQITKVLEPGNFEVIFYDGFSMQVKAKQMSRMPKEQAEKMEIPFPKQTEAEKDKIVDMEEIGSKEERRKRKKKIEVAELFRCYKKRPSNESAREGGTPTELIPKDEEKDTIDEVAAGGSTPVPPQIEKKKKKKKLIKDHGDIIKLVDDKLPENWEKKAKFKTSATKAGKWDVVIIGPDGRTFRSKQEIKQYLTIRQLDHDLELFDFRLGENFYTSRGLEVPVRARKTTIVRSSSSSLKNSTLPKKQEPEVMPASITATPSVESTTVSAATMTTVEANLNEKGAPPKLPAKSEPVAVPIVEPETPTFVPEEDGYRCPVEDCRKLFRRDNLLGMHIKHYHPALLKKLGCKTFRVEDLATARTAFETEDVVKTVPVSHSHSILASILTLPPQSSPSPPPPRLRQSLERKVDKEKEKLVDSPASDDLQNLPLSKRISLSESQQRSGSSASSKAARRKGEKRRIESTSEEAQVYLPESESELDYESKLCGLEEPQLPLKSEEPIVSTLDDIPGQKELVHCFCGSPEEDGLMIQCELCLCWQHGICLAIDTEENVPDPYVCHFCRYPFRERLSRRYTHDQTWLKKGQLPSLKFISGSSSVPADRTLRVAHTLTAAATDLKQLLHSLKVKIDVAKNKDHPKLYLWAQPWNKKTEPEASSNLEASSNVNQEETKSLVPNIPLPETPIDATDCRLNLLLHIADMQNEVNTRLESLEGLFEECEIDDGLMDTSHVAKMLQILLKDVVTLKRMASFSWSS